MEDVGALWFAAARLYSTSALHRRGANRGESDGHGEDCEDRVSHKTTALFKHEFLCSGDIDYLIGLFVVQLTGFSDCVSCLLLDGPQEREEGE